MSERHIHAFDLDNTLVNGCLTERAVWKIAEHRPLTDMQQSSLEVLAKERATLLKADGTLAGDKAGDYIWRSVYAFVDIVRGVPLKTMRRIAEELAEQDAGAVYTEMRTKINAIRDGGDIAVVISASPGLLVSAFSRRIGAAASAGSRYYRQGNEMHRWRPPRDPHAKNHTLQAMCDRLGGSAVAAYGDTLSDLAMLNMVEQPHAVNPVPELRAHATSQGWPIIDCAKY